MKRIESAFEKIKAADKIQEDPWQEVVLRELNEISKDYSKELQTETDFIHVACPPFRISTTFSPTLVADSGFCPVINLPLPLTTTSGSCTYTFS